MAKVHLFMWLVLLPGATANDIPPSTLEALGVGFAEGFVSDGPEVMTCGQLALGDVLSIREGFKDLREGITHLNITEVEKAIVEFKDVFKNIPSTEKTCKTVAADLGSILGALKQIHGPKDLLFHIIDHAFDDSEKIFGELAAAERAYKTGWDYMTAGQQMGMSARRLLIGEGGDAPTPAPAPPAAKMEMLEGIAIGFISDNLDFAQCSMDLRHESSDFRAAFGDFEQGLKHLNLTEIEDAIKEFEAFVKGAAPTKATCAAAVSAVEADVKTIIAALKSVHGIRELIFKVIDNFFGDGDEIFGELSAAAKAFRLAQYVGSGRELGMAFRRMLVGRTTPSPAPPAPPTHCAVGDTVHCPHLPATQMCAGNQCCPDGSTCPSADDSFSGCSKPKTEDCTKMLFVV